MTGSTHSYFIFPQLTAVSPCCNNDSDHVNLADTVEQADIVVLTGQIFVAAGGHEARC